MSGSSLASSSFSLVMDVDGELASVDEGEEYRPSPRSFLGAGASDAVSVGGGSAASDGVPTVRDGASEGGDGASEGGDGASEGGDGASEGGDGTGEGGGSYDDVQSVSAGGSISSAHLEEVRGAPPAPAPAEGEPAAAPAGAEPDDAWLVCPRCHISIYCHPDGRETMRKHIECHDRQPPPAAPEPRAAQLRQQEPRERGGRAPQADGDRQERQHWGSIPRGAAAASSRPTSLVPGGRLPVPGGPSAAAAAGGGRPPWSYDAEGGDGDPVRKRRRLHSPRPPMRPPSFGGGGLPVPAGAAAPPDVTMRPRRNATGRAADDGGDPDEPRPRAFGLRMPERGAHRGIPFADESRPPAAAAAAGPATAGDAAGGAAAAADDDDVDPVAVSMQLEEYEGFERTLPPSLRPSQDLPPLARLRQLTRMHRVFGSGGRPPIARASLFGGRGALWPILHPESEDDDSSDTFPRAFLGRVRGSREATGRGRNDISEAADRRLATELMLRDRGLLPGLAGFRPPPPLDFAMLAGASRRRVHRLGHGAARAAALSPVGPYERLIELGELLGEVNRGITTEQIEANSFIAKHSVPAGGEAVTCVVCQDDLEDGADMRTLGRCGHSYHPKCIDTWLKKSKKCPLCNEQVTPPQPEAPAAAGPASRPNRSHLFRGAF